MLKQKTALLFPGQGTQYNGMGSYLYNQLPIVKEIYDKARDILGFDTLAPLFNYPIQSNKAEIRDYARIAIFVASHALYEALRQILPDLRYDATAGHSLGQYNALVASNAILFDEALTLSQRRDDAYHDFSRKVNGRLIALLSKSNGMLSNGNLSTQLYELEQKGVFLALDNAPTQIIVGGIGENLEEIVGKLKPNNTRAIRLDSVEGPFHTIYMKDAADFLKEHIDSTSFNIAAVPLVANSSARLIMTPDDIKQEIYMQIYRPVRWVDSINRMIEQGITLFIAIGADDKEIVKSMVHKINPDVRVLVVKNIETLKSVAEELGE